MLEAALIGEIPREAAGSFDEVLRRREASVLRTAFRILGNWADAEDVAQEVFLRLHRHGLDFANDGATGAWLYRVTVNLCFDRTRSRRSSQELLGQTQYSYTDSGLNTSGDFMEGQKTVLGKISGMDEDSAIFVVIALKVLD